MSANCSTKKGWTSKKGAFIEGIWKCECDPRLPAEKFQTKNGGKNHGRWFLTCQKGKPKSCGFFLWADDAKLREEGALLSNSRSEPKSIPSAAALLQTPKKPIAPAQAPTPDTRTRTHERASSSQTLDFEHEDTFDWPSSDDEALANVAAQATAHPPPLQPIFETPRKAAKTTDYSSPGKRPHTELLNNTTTIALQTACDIFSTPSTSLRSRGGGLASPSPTPAHARFHSLPTRPDPSTLALAALTILHHNPLALLPSVEDELISLLNAHDLRTQGIAKGREITRLAVTARERRITELENRIAGLEIEKETQRQVIGHLKQDTASPVKSNSPYPKSPGRGRGRSGLTAPVRRSEV